MGGGQRRAAEQRQELPLLPATEAPPPALESAHEPAAEGGLLARPMLPLPSSLPGGLNPAPEVEAGAAAPVPEAVASLAPAAEAAPFPPGAPSEWCCLPRRFKALPSLLHSSRLLRMLQAPK